MKNMKTRRWWVLGALSFGLIAVGLDMTVLNVALPTLATELHASMSELQWFVNAYSLVLAAILLPAGMLGDRFGRKKWLLMALILFGAASIGCAFSKSPEMLIGMRALLGLGAAFLIPLSISVLPVLFSENERTKAMMIWATANMLGIPLGPIVGGWLLKNYHWGSVFLLNIPFVVVALIAVTLLMPESKSAIKQKLDLFGVVTSSIGLVVFTYGITKAGEKGWDNIEVLTTLIGGIVVLIGFILWQQKSKNPLIDLSLFRAPSFTWGSLLATLVSFAIFGLLFGMPQYFQVVAGADSFGTGVRLLPMIAGLIVGAKAADKFAARINVKNIVATGFVLIAIGLAMGATTEITSHYSFVAFWMTIFGFGLGLALPMLMDLAIGELSVERSGVGSALIMALRQVGGAIGVALLGTVLNSSYRGHINVTHLPAEVTVIVKQSASAGVAIANKLHSVNLLDSVRSSFVHGMDIMLLLCSGFAVMGFVLTLIYLPNKETSIVEKKVS
ncbi:DHA2 family efflux MFS transporter permease subunit [Heyndrickxia sp. NPDC080065]|uniref:DHA2 family efflux MFS transporter permease subunit n=1 Tax=Heyndrickxia sp. NPDC080065 TaxID=3390568 RepID=UPI003CFC4478